MEMTLVEKLEGMRKFTIEHYNPMAASGAITVIDELIHWHKKQAGINRLLAASGPHKFSTEEVIEAIQVQWIKVFGKLADDSERDGYFVSGFVHEALKAACASGAVAKGVCADCCCENSKLGQQKCDKTCVDSDQYD